MPYPTQPLVEMGPNDIFLGEFATTSLLPNVSGSTNNSRYVRQGSLATVLGVLYMCTTSPEGTAVWVAVAPSGGAGVITVGTGGIVPLAAPVGVYNWQPIAATSGTDTTPADGTQFVTSIWLPADMTITNVNYLIGSVGGTNKVYAVIYSSAGAVLANTSLTGGGATVGTAANIQTLALTATLAAKGPTRLFIGVSINGNTARLRTVPAFCQAGQLAGSVSQTHGTTPTVAAITAPTTFTADKAPVVFLD